MMTDLPPADDHDPRSDPPPDARPDPQHDHERCIDAALEQAASLCDRRGARLTKLRRRVLELVWQDHAAVKAYDILAQLGADSGAAKPPTVYRALDFLIDQGLVHRLASLNAFIGCPQPHLTHVGQFLICDACGEVSEFRAPAIEREIEAQASAAAFAVREQTVEVRGRCRLCREPAPAAP